MKEVYKELNLDSAEDGDLIHDDEDKEQSSKDADWNWDDKIIL